MKKLIMTGFGCPKEVWYKLFPDSADQKIVTLADVLDGCESNDIKTLAKSIVPVISSYQPDVLVLHDFGVLFGLLALLEMRSKRIKMPAKIIIFNGGFRGFNVLKQRHPFKMQIASFDVVQQKIKRVGSELDPALKPHFNRIKKIYQQVIVGSLITLAKELFQKRKPLNINLGSPILIIASSNDPFIPMASLDQIAADFKGTKLEVCSYGHYPYTGDCDYLRQRVAQFEKEDSVLSTES